MFNKIDKASLVLRNQNNYRQYGYSPCSLDWNKGKQAMRFGILTSMLNVHEGASVIDIGCGFGDLFPIWHNVTGGGGYTGVDIVPEFIGEAKTRHSGANNAEFLLMDFLDDAFATNADFAAASGPFNYKFEHTDNYKFIEACMIKAFELSSEGFAFDFLSDKVDWKYDNSWYSSPAVILEMAYGLSRNVVLRNDYMPFEFSIAVFKDASFEKADTVFNRYKRLYT